MSATITDTELARDIFIAEKIPFLIMDFRVNNGVKDTKSYEGRVKDWKKRGLILHEDETIDMIYERYLSTIQCETCNVVLEGNGANQKCMDHCHITGHFRNILCKACNSKRRD